MTHSFINIAAPLPRGREQAVIDGLDALGNPLGDPLRSIVDGLNRIHFFSLTVVPGDANYQPYLILEISADGDEESLLRALAEQAEDILVPVFRQAEDYGDAADIASYWLAHRIQSGFGYFDTPGIGHTGTPGLTVARIRKEAELSAAACAIFQRTSRDGSALDVLQRVRAELNNKPEFTWAFTPEPAQLLQGEKPGQLLRNILRRWPHFVLVYLWPLFALALFISAVRLWPDSYSGIMSILYFVLAMAGAALALGIFFSGVFVALVYRRLRHHEKTDPPDDSPPDHAKLTEIRKREDHCLQNHLAGVSIIKPGWVRKLTLRFVYWLIYTAATTSYRPGFLHSVGSIHFARWFVIPGTNRLLFFSNYGGSWESYLEDFIARANLGLTGVWSNTLGFPRTENLLFKGATDGDRFKRWARRQQNPTWCWYSAYPQLSTARIRINAAIRQGIARIENESDARDWLALFGSNVLPHTELQHDNVQGILFGGFGPLRHSVCLLMALPQDISAAKSWLGEIAPLLTFGDYRPSASSAMICAFSAAGLRGLGLQDNEIATFPHAFAQGMAARARILGDTGSNDPSHWTWGGARAVDAVLLLYAPDQTALRDLAQRERDRLHHLKGRVVADIPLETLPPRGTPLREPFGFVDGISQPIMRGTGRHRPGTRDQHIVEPGEFILGYPDGLGTMPQTPYVAAAADPANDLYSVAGEQLRQRPDFSPSRVPVLRDLGRDGSFMVVRQLEQHVKAFEAFVEHAAVQLNSGPCPLQVDKRWVGAKLVGRWHDGSSLVRNPFAPASDRKHEPEDKGSEGKSLENEGSDLGKAQPRIKPDNDFLFGKEDPQGLRCPFGSHVRRANPRDSFRPGSVEELRITNRHRILRAGRIYSDGDKKGLLFVCLNGDLERQFEFVQQTWTLAKTFHGLESETDPFINDMGDSSRYTIPMADGARMVTGLSSFVTTKGGEYFFLPGKQTIRFLSRTR